MHIFRARSNIAVQERQGYTIDALRTGCVVNRWDILRGS